MTQLNSQSDNSTRSKDVSDAVKTTEVEDNDASDLDQVISFEEKAIRETENWQILRKQLIENRLEFEIGPNLGHVQFSNYCNLSCIMCWNGNNPRTKKIPPGLLCKIESQLGPYLSVMTPFSGSEPLTLTWKETRRMAEKYGVLLRITSNLQFLDEEKFFELKDITETLCVSVDCHIPEVLEKIRKRSITDTIFENLATTSRLAREHEIELITNVVLLTYNAPFLADTMRFLHGVGIESVDVIQMVDINHESYYFDPLIHFTAEYIQWVKQESVEVAKELGMRLIWNVGQVEIFDFREDPIATNQRKVMNDHHGYLMKHFVPGFCPQVMNRVRLEIDGDVAPCFLATEGELSLGNLNNEDFDDIWNGTNARDLRRGHFTDDVPALCKGCRLRSPLPPRKALPFADHVTGTDRFFKHGVSSEETVTHQPVHVSRTEAPVKLQIKSVNNGNRFLVALALGGQIDEIHKFKTRAKQVGQEGELYILEIQIPSRLWGSLRPNVGYWWAAWQKTSKTEPVIRNDLIRCFVKHQTIDRLPESELRYDDLVTIHTQNREPMEDSASTKRIQREPEL